MSITTRIRKAYHAVGVWFITKLENIKWAGRMADALKGVEPADVDFVKTCLTNQMNHMRMTSNHGPVMFASRAAMNRQHDLIFNIARRVVLKLRDLRHIVGVQPMQGPVGLVFHLRYESIEDNIAESPAKRMRLLVSKEAVEAGSRKLQARWTMEAAQDLAAVHGVDFEQELQDALSTIIAEEIFSEVIADLFKIATSNTASCVVVNHQDAPERAFTSNAELAISLNRLCNQIAASTRRGAGNFIVTTPMGAVLLQAISTGRFVETPGPKTAGPLVHVGTLNDTVAVFSSTLLPSVELDVDPFLVGFKGKGDIDTGYVYSPYVPIMPTGPVIDPHTFVPTMTLMTRYGKKQMSPVPESADATPYYGLIKFGPEGTTLVDQPRSDQ